MGKKGLVYKLSQKCLDQEEEINNLLHNVAQLQEVVERKQTEINRQRSKINMLQAKLDLVNDQEFINIKIEDYEIEKHFEEVFAQVENIMNNLKTN